MIFRNLKEIKNPDELKFFGDFFGKFFVAENVAEIFRKFSWFLKRLKINWGRFEKNFCKNLRKRGTIFWGRAEPKIHDENLMKLGTFVVLL